MSEHIEWQELHELLKELAQKKYGDKYGEQIFWYFQDVIDDSCKLDSLEEENKRLHSIIKEVRKYIKEKVWDCDDGVKKWTEEGLVPNDDFREELLEILEKENEK